MPHTYPNFLNKGNNPFECKCQIVLTTFGFLLMQVKVMADDVITPSNPPIAPIEDEKLEETPLNVNVFQRSREEEPSRKVVRTRVDRSVWDRQMSPNPHALVIYLEFFLARGATLKRFEECQCEDDDVHFHCRTWVPGDGHYR
jgi:hypothetical protein